MCKVTCLISYCSCRSKKTSIHIDRNWHTAESIPMAHYLLFRYLFISGYIVTSNHLLHNFSRILWELCRDNHNQIPNKYSRLSLNRHLYKTNTSVKPTPRVGPCLSLPLFLTLDKTDISLRWTLTTGSKGVHLRESWLYSQTLLIQSLRGP